MEEDRKLGSVFVILSIVRRLPNIDIHTEVHRQRDRLCLRLYGAAPEGPTRRYSPAECPGAKKVPIEGAPDPKHISTF